MIANFTVVYASMDQDQILFFQDNVEIFDAIGKLEILPSPNNTFEIGPDCKLITRLSMRISTM